MHTNTHIQRWIWEHFNSGAAFINTYVGNLPHIINLKDWSDKSFPFSFEFYIFHTEHVFTRIAKQQTNTCTSTFIASRSSSLINPTCFGTLRYLHQGWRLKYETPTRHREIFGCLCWRFILQSSPWWWSRSVSKHVGFVSEILLLAIKVFVHIQTH
jgi:hypothetical protein